MSTLNLLNPLEIKKVEKIKVYFLVKHFLVQIVSIIFIICTVFIFSAIILQSDSTSLDEQIQNEITIRKESNVSSIEDSTKQLNIQLSKVEQIQNTYIEWTIFINNFSLLIPTAIALDDIEFNTNILEDTTEMTFQLKGIATERNDLIKLQENLEGSKYFTDINTPISNLIQKENINFSITGNLTNEIKK